jgi:phosphoglycerol transferase MdoB-like AlkP superfamily enzyme
VKYTDYALGEFFERARQSPYWQDTIFLVIADHNSRVFGSNLVPVEGFHIPGLILGGSIQPRTVSHLASQIDMLPTLLSLAGVEAEIPATGIDVMRDDIDRIPGRAIMQFANNQAYMENDNVVILTPGKRPRQFKYVDKQLRPVDHVDGELRRKALAHSIWPTMAYQRSLYRARGDRT